MTTKVPLNATGHTILQIETVSTCNMACRFCAYPLRKDKRSTLPTEVVFRLLDEVDASAPGFEYVTFSQFNEPLLDGRIYGFLEHARNKSIPVLFITNGLLLARPRTRSRLLDTAPAQIKISLQTLDAATFECVRGTNVPFADYVAGLAVFLAEARHHQSRITLDVACNFLSPKGRVVSTVLGLAQGDPSVPSSLASLRPDLERFLAMLARLAPDLDISPARLAEFLRNATTAYVSNEGLSLAPNIRLKVKPFMYGRKLADYQPARHPARCGNRIIGVLADGSVVPCCLDYDGELRLGDARTEALASILERNAPFLASLRDRHAQKPPMCARCLGQPTRRGALTNALLQRMGK